MWVKLDDKFWSSAKVNELSSEAGFLLTRLWSYIGDQGSDGYLPAVALRLVWHSPTALAELIERNFMHERDGITCECGDHVPPSKTGGYVMHQWLERNPSRDEHTIHATKANERKSSELRKLLFDRDMGLCRYCGTQTNRFDRVSPKQFQMDHVNPTMPIGIAGVATACRDCNSRKGARTPSAAQMPLLPPVQRLPGVDDPYDRLDVLDASLIPTNEPTKQVTNGSGGGNPGSGRVGSGRVGSGLVGSVVAPDLPESRPYMRSGFAPPGTDQPPVGLPPPAPPPAKPARSPTSNRPRQRKGRRR